MDTTKSDAFTAAAFEQQREALWDWCSAAEPGLTRERFDADFAAELDAMRAEDAARGVANGEGTMDTEPKWPAHKASLHVTHNQHRAYYETVEQAIESGSYRRDDFPDEAEIAACIAADSVWEIQWYPDTPIGSYTVYAATFTRALERANEIAAEDAARRKDEA